nr:hypothetical protein B0A51_03731 [Rachicladosporium sp. CCFEE 5018]
MILTYPIHAALQDTEGTRKFSEPNPRRKHGRIGDRTRICQKSVGGFSERAGIDSRHVVTPIAQHDHSLTNPTPPPALFSRHLQQELQACVLRAVVSMRR